jgi:hypothetical protein
MDFKEICGVTHLEQNWDHWYAAVNIMRQPQNYVMGREFFN